MISSKKYYLIIVIIIFCIFFNEICHADFGIVTDTQIQLFSSKTAYFTKNVQLTKMNVFVYDPIEKDIYVSDVNGEGERILRIKTSGQTAFNVTNIVAQNGGTLGGIAFDHSYSTLYWTVNDSIYFVQVPDTEITAPLNGKPLIKSTDGSITRIAIDVRGRYLYWVNFESVQLKSSIERLHLERSDREVLEGHLSDPRCLTVDVKNKMLYWIDWGTPDPRAIYSKDLLNVTVQKRSYVPKKNPYIIALDDLNVYWIHWRSKELWMIPKNSFGQDESSILVSEIDLNQYLVGLFILPVDDVKQISKDDHKKKDFGIVSDTQIQLFSSKTAYFTKNVQLTCMNAFVYDPIEKDIYVSDVQGEDERIYRIKTSGQTAFNVTHIVDQNGGKVGGIAFDHSSSTLYWTVYDSIFFAQVPDTEITAPLIGKPLLKSTNGSITRIAIDVHERYLYWVNFESVQLKSSIERLHLEESDREVLEGHLSDPRCLTVDVENNMLYWIDWGTSDPRAIYSKDLLNVTVQKRSYVPKKSPYIIALDDLNVYWIHWRSKELWMIPKNSFGRDNSSVLVSEIDFNQHIIGLFILPVDVVKQTSKEDVENQGNLSNLYNVRSIVTFVISLFPFKMLKK